MINFINFDHDDHIVQYDVEVNGRERVYIDQLFNQEFGRFVEGVFSDSRAPKTRMSMNYKVVLDNVDIVSLMKNGRLQDPVFSHRVHMIQDFLVRSGCPVPEIYSNPDGNAIFHLHTGENSLVLLSKFIKGEHYGAQIDLGVLGEAYGKVYRSLLSMGKPEHIRIAFEKRKPFIWDVVSHNSLSKILELPLEINKDLEIFSENENKLRIIINQVLETRLKLVNIKPQVVLGDPHPHNIIIDSKGKPYIIDFENAAANIQPASFDLGMAMHRSVKMDLSKMADPKLSDISERCQNFIDGVKTQFLDFDTKMLVPGALDKSLSSLLRLALRVVENEFDNWQYVISLELNKQFHNILELEVIAEATKDVF